LAFHFEPSFQNREVWLLVNDQGPMTKDESSSDYNLHMLDENDFRKRADTALESLKKSLMQAEESSDIEVEDQSGALHISFEDRSKFVISPNAPVRQIWISALATSFKLDWSDSSQDFVLSKTGEKLKILVARLINQQLGEELVTLA
jgi:iron donor protein CyaY